LPALRERRDDVPLLARHFLELAANDGLPRKVLGEDAAQLLSLYSWPGNVRELQNLMQRLAVLSREDVIGAAVVRQILPAAQISQGPFGQAVDQVQEAVRTWVREKLAGQNAASGAAEEILHDALLSLVEPVLLRETLLSVDGNQIRAAQLLGINRNTLRKKLNDYGLDPVNLRRGE
jgi:two-component system nitrogen regulation response regulator GlnG